MTLSDFGIASRARSEQHAPGLPHLIEGTLAYMSPEQTGRMNRDLDHRSDLLFPGRGLLRDAHRPPSVLVGRSAGADSWARGPGPVAPAIRNASVPVLLSDLVLRLIAKNAEDRYQSAEGVEADLARAEAAWKAHGRIEPFALGEEELPCATGSRFRSDCMGGRCTSPACSKPSREWPGDGPSWCWSQATPASARRR